jgi:hypothetical protein
MADNIDRILTENPGNKVVFWVGSQHIRSEIVGKAATEFILDKYSTVTLNSVYERRMAASPLAELTASLNRPLVISTNKAKAIGSLPTYRYNDFDPVFEHNFNYIIIYPNPKY